MGQDNGKYRFERIERLLDELKYEVTRGMMEGEIEDETLVFQFIVPQSKQIPRGLVWCEFRTRPMTASHLAPGLMRDSTKLRVVK